MDFSKLKELAKTLGGILIMNGNEPEFIVMAYDKFAKLETPPAGEAGPTPVPVNSIEDKKDRDEEERLINTLNNEILALKEEIRQKETAELVAEEPAMI